jgi:membrane protease YdiL (CAAX protease family)
VDFWTLDNEKRPWLRQQLVARWWEITLMLAVMLGPYAFSAIRMGLRGRDFNILDAFNTLGITHNIAIEAGMLAAMLFYLRWRGWKPADFSIRIDPIGTALAVPLQIVASIANLATAFAVLIFIVVMAPQPHGFLAAVYAAVPQMKPHHIEIAWTAIVIGSIVNGYLEELVFMGYGFNQFAAKRGPLFAVLVMVFLRMLLHTYKGPVGMLGIGAFSFVYGFAYITTRRLWPLILAHIVTDIIAFAAVKLTFGH